MEQESKYFRTAARMDEAFLALLAEKDFDYITVKELCQRAGVNRSTFYLHYETIADLLSECIDYTNNKCFAHYGKYGLGLKGSVASAELEDLVFITPEYLRPYLEFVRENKLLMRTVMSHPQVMNTEKTFSAMFDAIFSPILDRFRYPEGEKRYVMAFYIQGFMGVISEWLKNDCRDSIEKITGIFMKCIVPQGLALHLERFGRGEAP